MGNQNVTPWSDDKIADLTKLWAEGHSATRIGIALECSRNAVIGKIARLRLPAPASKQPVIIDRTYSRQCPDVTRAKRNEYQRRYQKAQRELRRLSIETKQQVRAQMLARGTSPTSAAYRQHLPPMPEMTKGQLRAMLAQAVQNTVAP